MFVSKVYTSYLISTFRNSNSIVVFLRKKVYTNCLVLVGHRNGFELDFTIELK